MQLRTCLTKEDILFFESVYHTLFYRDLEKMIIGRGFGHRSKLVRSRSSVTVMEVPDSAQAMLPRLAAMSRATNERPLRRLSPRYSDPLRLGIVKPTSLLHMSGTRMRGKQVAY